MKFTILLLSSALFVAGCTRYQPAPQQYVKPVVKKPVKKVHKPRPKATAPKKEHELKVVEDENFSSEYMYPETDKKSSKKPEEKTSIVENAETPSAVSPMTNTECISMIGQEKFDKYTQMLGSEAGAIKKCAMLKAL